jgi:hypothetical protein
MDESSSDLDQLFKEAAQNAAGLAHVLDPTKAVERGTKLRRFARRRRSALSGLVVLVAVVVFLVPLPQLHLFGPGRTHSTTGHQSTTSSLASTASTSPTATTSPVTGIGPLGGVMPADFEPGSFTAVSLEEWWMLGSGPMPRRFWDLWRNRSHDRRWFQVRRHPEPAGERERGDAAAFRERSRRVRLRPGAVGDDERRDKLGEGRYAPGPVAELEAADGEAYALGCPAGFSELPRRWSSSALAGRIAHVAEGVDARNARLRRAVRGERPEPVPPERE